MDVGSFLEWSSTFPAILRGVADPVEPFSFKFLQNDLLPPLLDGIGDRLGQQPDLSGELKDGQANELWDLEDVHRAFLSPFGWHFHYR